MSGNLEVYKTADELVMVAAERLRLLLNIALHDYGRATMALSGGTTQREIYSLLGSPEFRSGIDWSRVSCFWTDERCVPHYSPDSNFRLVSEALLRHIPIPPTNIHHVHTDLPPDVAAREYEQEIIDCFQLDGRAMPAFDVVLLGLGEDGRVASLFREHKVLEESKKVACNVAAENSLAQYITLTLPALNHARAILCVVAGKSRATILRKVLEGTPGLYPAQFIDPEDGLLWWMTETHAASQLQIHEAR